MPRPFLTFLSLFTNVVEEEFSEVRLYGVLRSSPYHNSRKFIYEMLHSGGRIGPSEPL